MYILQVSCQIYNGIIIAGGYIVGECYRLMQTSCQIPQSIGIDNANAKCVPSGVA